MTGSNSHVHYPPSEEISTKRIDVRSKIIASFFVILACSFIVTNNQLVWFIVLLMIYTLILRPRKSFIKYTLAALPIIFSLTLISFFSFSSIPVMYKNLFYQTVHNNVSFAIFSAGRAIVIVLFVLMTINSEESFFEIIYGLDDLKMPRLLTNLTFLTYRFFFLMQEELSRILEARSNRFYGQKNHLNLSSLKLTGNIIGSLLARSFKRAEHISATLSARGFSGKMSHPEQPWTPVGVIFIIFTMIYVLMLMVIGESAFHLLIGELL
ncbi:MAG: energy-coupling factor transporter transmembrane component T family protein [Candidatus Hodarchaeales archaeon]|jgi:cobalt/nickel transport system permease protein